MPEPAKPNATATKPTGGAPAARGPLAALTARIDWRAVWPVPLLILALAALGAGLFMAFMRAPKDDPAAPLVEVRAALDNADYEAAIALLNTKLMTPMQQGLLSRDQQREFYLLRARSIYQGQEKLGVRRPENFRAVLADYAQAMKIEGPVETADIASRSIAHLALGQIDEAVALARSVPEKDAALRLDLLRRIIRSNLAGQDVHYEQTLALLSEVAAMPGQSADDLAWAAARQTELRIAMGYYDEAITKLLRVIPTLGEVGAAARGELFYLLGQAYYESGQFLPAQKQLELAMRALPQFDPLRADGLVMLGRIQQASGQVEAARELFSEVYNDFPGARATLPALFGKAEAAGAMGDDEAALVDTAALLEAMKGLPPRRDLTPTRVGRSLMDRQVDRFTRGDFRRALQYAQASKSAYLLMGEDAVPPEVHLALAESARRLAEQILEEARTTEQGRISIEQVSPVTAVEAKKLLLDAGGAYRAHARTVVVTDNDAYLDSLWRAADTFDAAGDREASREGFQDYLDGAPDSDGRRPEARFRLAQTFHSQRQFSTAASIYRDLMQGRGRGSSLNDPALSGNFVGPPEPLRADDQQDAGLWADRAIVPLAQCYLADDTTSNDDEAESLLRTVLEGTLFSPESVEYREALTALGEYAYRVGRVEGDAGSIRLLEEAVSRYPDHPRRTVLLFKLADSNRHLAVQIAEELTKNMPSAERQRLSVERRQRLRSAMTLFQTVIDAVQSHPARLLTDLDKLHKRNAAFYVADCALELEDYATAIKLYDTAAQAYAADPASLVARMQIVRAYVKQRRWNEAGTANERAKRQLATLPDSVFESPDLPMQRRHWEAWLEADALIQQRRQAEASAAAGGAP